MSGIINHTYSDNRRIFSIDYPDESMYRMLKGRATADFDSYAASFMGRRTTYAEMIDMVDKVSCKLHEMGLSKGDTVMINLPNCTQAAIAFYAVNRCGGICEMIHPLSVEREIDEYISKSDAKIAFAIDLFAEKFINRAERKAKLEHVVIVSVKEYLGSIGKIYYHFKAGRKLPDFNVAGVKRFPEMLTPSPDFDAPQMFGKDPAVILHTGGTGGKSKRVLLSNMNMNATALQSMAAAGAIKREWAKMLTAMPIFHGFGLCVSLHMMMIEGGECIFIPRFTPDSYARIIKKEKPNYIAGVPSLFEKMIKSKHLKNADLSHLKGIFVGGDSLSEDLRGKMEKFLRERNCNTQVREGYGLTECVSASCLTPATEYRPGSIGVPYADTEYGIFEVGSDKRLDVGMSGEICINGPSVMIGYLNDPAGTDEAIHIHDDGKRWLHTGDMGQMDADGFVYFKNRIKRIIVTSGYNVYPAQIEGILDAHPNVMRSCVIGIPDDIRKEVVKAFLVLKDKTDIERTIEDIKQYCRKRMIHYCIPFEFEVLDDMPMTLVGKVAFGILQERENSKSPY